MKIALSPSPWPFPQRSPPLGTKSQLTEVFEVRTAAVPCPCCCSGAVGAAFAFSGAFHVLLGDMDDGGCEEKKILSSLDVNFVSMIMMGWLGKLMLTSVVVHCVFLTISSYSLNVLWYLHLPPFLGWIVDDSMIRWGGWWCCCRWRWWNSASCFFSNHLNLKQTEDVTGCLKDPFLEKGDGCGIVASPCVLFCIFKAKKRPCRGTT